nr:ribonuclease H-like domain-containing protein [Tanacetum cinerariifolium]
MDLETAQTTTTAKLPILKQAQTTTNADGTSTTLIPGPVTTEEKVQKKNDVKARSMLLMTLPNEHIMTFNQYKDAKTLFATIQIRFYGNEATKKTQKTLLKQMYENFSAPSTESLDSNFNSLRKIVSQLAILGENISQELNLNFLRSLPSEWNTHVVVWRNKHDLDTMSFIDLYNNFKIVEQDVKGTTCSSSSSQNMAFVSSPNNTNKVNTAYGVSTANTQISPASTQVSTDRNQASTANLSDATIYAFLASQPNGKITINGSDTAAYDKSKVECFNCHKFGYFTKECRQPMNQDSRNRNQDSSRRTVNVEETASKALVTVDGVEFNKSKFNLATYKRGLASVEEQLVFYKMNDQNEGISFVQEDTEIQGSYGYDTGINTASTSITTASINISTAEHVTTVSASVTTAGVSVSTAEPSTPLITTTTTLIEDEDLIIAQTLMKMRTNETASRPTVPPQQQIDLKDKGKGNGKKAESSGKEAVSKKRTEEELDQESSKRQKTSESSKLAEEPRDKEADELSQKELQQMMIIVPVQGMNVEALQTKYPIINREIYTKGTRKYWKIIRVRNYTKGRIVGFKRLLSAVEVTAADMEVTTGLDRKSTSGVCTFMGYWLTSWFSKKQTALAIFTTEAEYVSVEKACQQALWMKQALVDYDIKLADLPILCDNNGAIDLYHRFHVFTLAGCILQMESAEPTASCHTPSVEKHEMR